MTTKNIGIKSCGLIPVYNHTFWPISKPNGYLYPLECGKHTHIIYSIVFRWHIGYSLRGFESYGQCGNRIAKLFMACCRINWLVLIWEIRVLGNNWFNALFEWARREGWKKRERDGEIEGKNKMEKMKKKHNKGCNTSEIIFIM